MAHFILSVNCKKRQERHQLIRFLDALHLHLKAGFEFTYAWEMACQVESVQSNPVLRQKLVPTQATFEEHLRSFDHSALKVLHPLYQQGASMVEAVKSVATTLRLEEAADLESHLRSLPVKMQVILILFFFPPTVLILLAPVILSLSRVFVTP